MSQLLNLPHARLFAAERQDELLYLRNVARRVSDGTWSHYSERRICAPRPQTVDQFI